MPSLPLHPLLLLSSLLLLLSSSLPQAFALPSPGCEGSADANNPNPLSRFACGCEPVSGGPYMYPGQRRAWDPNALSSVNPWDNSQSGGNLPSNFIDQLNNDVAGGDALNDSSLITVVRPYPMCFGGSYPGGSSSNCLQQYDAKNHPDDPTGFSDEFFCEGEARSSNSFLKGDTSPPICIVYGGGNRLQKMRFYPKVDQFALLTIQKSFNSTEGLKQVGHFGTTFQVELNGIQSAYRHRYGSVGAFDCVDQQDSTTKCLGSSTCIVVPFHTIVIKLSQGTVESIEWDDDDSLCNTDHSVDGNCGIDVQTCQSFDSYTKENTATATDCDFKLYVSWAGTDRDGTFLSSSQRRLSQFRRWSLKAVYNQASSFDTKDLPSVPTDEE